MENDDLSKLEELLVADIENNSVENFNGEKAILTNGVIKTFTSECSGENLKQSVVHSGDTDSSDDEEKRNFTERKYNDYGTVVKRTLDNQEKERCNNRLEFETRLRQTNLDVKIKRVATTKDSKLIDAKFNAGYSNTYSTNASDVYTDPIFGIRIVKPLISNTALVDKIQGREAINMLRVKRHVEHGDLSTDWVIAGVIVRKSSSKQSQKGSQFLIWTLSDLKDDFKTVSIFLFRKAYNELWKTSEGVVVAILNPNVLDRSENSTDQACLSVDNPDRVMIIGQSKDLGTCKSKKKNGDPCTAFVNKNQCEHCIYHVKQEYQKFSRRQELQSSTMGRGITSLRNKVLGKNTVIYGGKSYSALPKAKSNKVLQKDQNTLMSLSDYYKSEGDKLLINKAPFGAKPLQANSELHLITSHHMTDSERLNKLNSHPCLSANLIGGNLIPLAEKIAHSPTFGLIKPKSGNIDLNISYGQKAAERAKTNAINLIKKCGGIEKKDPNNIKGTITGKKRALENMNDSDIMIENENKKIKIPDANKAIMSDRFKKILEATSAHQNLIEQHDNDEQNEYFNKLEKKEAMEEKMLNTFKLACKAVRCAKCKYIAFSAAKLCKDERHPLKVLDTFKRFFKCADCGNRTVSLEIIPLHACSNCNSSHWKKAPMMREKKVISNELSIRGEEEKFVGSFITSGKNINLLMPDS